MFKKKNEGSPVDIHFDFQKAFDKVPHQRLLLKLKACGIFGETYASLYTLMRAMVFLGKLVGTTILQSLSTLRGQFMSHIVIDTNCPTSVKVSFS